MFGEYLLDASLPEARSKASIVWVLEVDTSIGASSGVSSFLGGSSEVHQIVTGQSEEAGCEGSLFGGGAESVKEDDDFLDYFLIVRLLEMVGIGRHGLG